MQVGSHAGSVAIRNSKSVKKRADYLNKRRKNRSKTYAYIAFYSLLVAFLAMPSLYYSGYISYDTFNFYGSALLSFLFSSGAVAYLFFRGLPPKEIKKSLGVSSEFFSSRMLGIGIVLFLIVLVLEMATSLISSITGVQINTNVGLVFQGAPIWFAIFAVLIAPINEEIFFRGLLVPRIGMIASALLFGMLHATYNSTFGIEIIAAFIFGLLSGYVFKKTKSLYPSIIAHMLVNALALFAIFSV